MISNTCDSELDAHHALEFPGERELVLSEEHVNQGCFERELKLLLPPLTFPRSLSLCLHYLAFRDHEKSYFINTTTCYCYSGDAH